jgi:hypothetical protein
MCYCNTEIHCFHAKNNSECIVLIRFSFLKNLSLFSIIAGDLQEIEIRKSSKTNTVTFKKTTTVFALLCHITSSKNNFWNRCTEDTATNYLYG